jgi:hypothetical protein
MVQDAEGAGNHISSLRLKRRIHYWALPVTCRWPHTHQCEVKADTSFQCTRCTYRVFSAQADWTLIRASHKDTEQSTIDASVTLDGVTLTGRLIR